MDKKFGLFYFKRPGLIP